MARIILIAGLSKSGKTTLAEKLIVELKRKHTVQYLNGDAVRQKFNHWDFSVAGRISQSVHIKDMIDERKDFVVVDTIAPLLEQRRIICPDFIIWMDTMAFDIHNGNVPFEDIVHPRLFKITDCRRPDIKFIASILQDKFMYDFEFYSSF